MQEDYDNCTIYYNKSLDIRLLKEEKDSVEVSDCYYELSVYIQQEEFNKSSIFFLKSICY
jgi:hypothetical protein